MFNVLFLGKQRKSRERESHRPDIHEIKVIVGLGNPGKGYGKTYHNVGCMFLDFMAERSPGTETPTIWNNLKLFRYAEVGGLTLVKTNVFMNNSGRSVKAALRYFNIPPQKMLVIHDDSDISIGNYKLSFGSGSAGHKGVGSITNTIKTNKFLRLRIGIRKSKEKAGKFVLKRVDKSDTPILEAVFMEIKEELPD